MVTGSRCDDFTVAPLVGTLGVTLKSGPSGRPLDEISDQVVYDHYTSSGAVMFRGFESGLEPFERFTSRFLTECVVNGNATRGHVVADKRIQTVNGGCDPIPLHAEMAYSPIRPDTLFFYCATPPIQGSGETLICDGVEVWRQMAVATRRLFEESAVRYRFRRTRMHAGQLEGHEHRIAGDPRVRLFKRYEDGTVDLDFVVPAVQPGRHCADLAFANSVIVESQSAGFEDGRELSQAQRFELFVLTTRLSGRVAWEPGDILMLDNSRIMHGRNRIRPDDGRSIAIRMGWSRFQESAAPRLVHGGAPVRTRGGEDDAGSERQDRARERRTTARGSI